MKKSKGFEALCVSGANDFPTAHRPEATRVAGRLPTDKGNSQGKNAFASFPLDKPLITEVNVMQRNNSQSI
jgi:hypothetical protein